MILITEFRNNVWWAVLYKEGRTERAEKRMAKSRVYPYAGNIISDCSGLSRSDAIMRIYNTLTLKDRETVQITCFGDLKSVAEEYAKNESA